ncbi:hypothetical protein [Burkholderia sp. F1]|uniref:hypothetical protein n=1 Tax=Burkholderia sp. F1 TaxID=3366817 RepID=UPI003D714B61
MADSDIDAVYSHVVAIKSYMNARAMQKIATAPDKTFLDRVADAYHALLPSGAAAPAVR